MKRELFTHKTGVTEGELTILVLDEKGQGNANHEYNILCPDDDNVNVHFQNGPIKENGVNGVTNEALLALVIDRLEGFQSGPFSCKANAVALTHIEEAMMWLQKRTHDRVRRGVEGTNQQ